MEVVPSINEVDFEAVKRRLSEIKSLGATRAHIDVSDGLFTEYKSWNNPLDLKVSDLIKIKGLKIEVHLMIEDPDDVFEYWIEAGAKKIIVHIESAKKIRLIKQQCEKAGAELALAINPETAINGLFNEPDIKNFLILGVRPGPSGQKFDENQLEKIKLLRAKMPDAKIEVDGGVNPEIAGKLKEAGADEIVSGAYIWNSPNPQKAYEELSSV